MTTTRWNIHLTWHKYTVAVTCTLFLPYGRTSCDLIGDVTILSWFYDPSNENSYQAGHSLSFSIWSESSLSAWRNLRSLTTHRKISRSSSAKCRGISPRSVAEFLRELSRSVSAKFLRENPRRNNWFFFSAKNARGVPRRNAKKELFLIIAYLFTLFICTLHKMFAEGDSHQRMGNIKI